MRAEIDARAVGEVPDRGTRRYYDPLEEVDVEAEAAIAIEGTFAGAKGADKRRHNPQHVAKAVLAQRQPGAPLPRFFVLGHHADGAPANPDAGRTAGGAEGHLRDSRTRRCE